MGELGDVEAGGKDRADVSLRGRTIEWDQSSSMPTLKEHGIRGLRLLSTGLFCVLLAACASRRTVPASGDERDSRPFVGPRLPRLEGTVEQATLEKGPFVVQGVTIVVNDQLDGLLRPYLVPPTPAELDLGVDQSLVDVALLQNFSQELLYLVPENSVIPVVLFPGYSALSLDGFVSAQQFNRDVGLNYYKIMPGMTVCYLGEGVVETDGLAVLRSASDSYNKIRQKGSSGWRALIPFSGFQRALEGRKIILRR